MPNSFDENYSSGRDLDISKPIPKDEIRNILGLGRANASSNCEVSSGLAKVQADYFCSLYRLMGTAPTSR